MFGETVEGESNVCWNGTKKVYEGIVIAKRVGYYMDGVVKELTERVDRSIR